MISLIEETPIKVEGVTRHVLDLQFSETSDFANLPDANRHFNSSNYSIGFDYGEPAQGSLATCIATGATYNYISGEWVEPGSGGSTTVYKTAITGDGTTTDFTITHNLGSRFCSVMVVDSDYNDILADITRATKNSYVIGFEAAPAVGTTYNVVIVCYEQET